MPRHSKTANQPTQTTFSDSHDILMNAPVGIFTSTPEGRYISVNRATARMFGYDTQQEMIESVTDIAAQVYADPADRVEFMRLMEEHGELSNHECRFRRRDGSEFWVSRNVRVVRNQDGIVVAFQGFTSDISGRKQADWALQKRIKELNCLYGISKLIETDDNPDAILQGVADLLPNSWQHSEVACARIIVEGREYLAGNFRETDWRQSAEIKVYGQAVGMIDLCYLEERPVMEEGPFLKQERNLIKAIAERLGKVTERKRAEEALREKNLFLDSITNTMTDLLSVTDMEGNYKFIGPSHSILGYDLDALIGRNVMEFVHPDDYQRVENALMEFVTNKEDGKKVEYRYRRDDGEYLWFETIGKFILDNAGNPKEHLFSTRDITERKQAEEKLKRIEWMLSKKPISSIEVHSETYDQGYGDLTELNRDGFILKSIGHERLKSFADDYLELLGTSSAIYEANGDYAFGIFASGWCRMMDRASRDLCDTPDNAEALNSGRWLCHESCWTDCSKEAIAKRVPVDIACNGGLRIYAVPILAHGNEVGAINFGYGDPPTDPETLLKLAKTYHLDYDDLLREANAYDSRPPFIIELAKKQLHSTARIIGSMVETKQIEEVLRESQETLRATLNSIGDAVISTDMDGLVVGMNPVAESLTGWNEEDVTGQPLETVFRIINEQTRQPVESPVTNVLKSGQIVGLANHTLLIARDGREVPIADSGAPIRNDAGEITGVVLVFRDQTKERAAQDALKANYALFQIAGETARFGGWSVDLEKNICTWSDAVADIHEVPYGYAPKVEDGINFYAPEWQDKITQVFSACAEKGIPYDEEMEIITQKERRVWVRTIGRAVKDEKNKISKVQGSFQDITERKKAEERNRDAHHRLLTILNGINALIYVADMNTYEILFANQLLNDTHEDIEGEKCWSTLQKGQTAPCDFCTNHKLLDNEGKPTGFYRWEFQNTRTGRWYECQDVAIKWIDGRTVRLEIAIDITERKQAENKLRESEKRYREILDSIEDGYFECNLAGTVTFCNPATARMTGYTIEECKGLNFRKICVDPEKAFNLFNRVLQSLRSEPSVVLELIRKDGSTGFAESLISPIINPKGRVKGFRGLGRDVTERKLAAEEKEKLQAQLLQAQKMESIGMLAGGVAHDFNNLLHAMGGNLELLDKKLSKDHPGKKRVKTIQNSMDRAAHLVKQMLLFSRKADIQIQVLDLNLEIQHAAEMLERTIPKMVNIELILDENARPINADPIQVEQMLLNLGTNAADVMPDGGRLIIETTNVTLDQDFVRTHTGGKPGKYVLMTVSDTGCGMDKETLQHIFDPFFTTKEVGKGTGLGLASVYGIIKAHEGYITCYSEPGQGTTFKIYWPAAEQVQADHVEAEPQEPDFLEGTETILIVDDDDVIRDLARELLEDKGYQALSAASGEQALEIFRDKAGDIDLVIMDLNMPGMGGRKCTKEMISIEPSVKVLVASGYSANCHGKQASEYGAKDFISKPYQMREILAKIREVLDRDQR